MKYSLRSLMIVAIVCPPLVAGIAWRLFPRANNPALRGTLVDEVIFLDVLKKPFPSNIQTEMQNCFVVGELADDRYEELLTAADRTGAPTHFIPGTPTLPTGTQYVFWCEGKNSKDGGDAWVVVIVDGNPSRITHAWVEVAKP
jgi:hypothetical protein